MTSDLVYRCLKYHKTIEGKYGGVHLYLLWTLFSSDAVDIELVFIYVCRREIYLFRPIM